MAPLIISIEGNIGVGKTTLLNKLSNSYACFPEPISKWTLLSSFYDNPKRFGSPLQFQILLSQYDQQQLFPKDTSVILVERSPEAARSVFVPLTLDEDLVRAYDRLYVNLAYKVDHFVYLDLDPKECFERIRNRSEMDSKIELDYLRRLQENYMKMVTMVGCDVDIVDASQSPDDVEQQVRHILSKRIPLVSEGA